MFPKIHVIFSSSQEAAAESLSTKPKATGATSCSISGASVTWLVLYYGHLGGVLSWASEFSVSNHSSVRFISVLFEKYGKRFAFMVSYCVDKTVLDLRSGFASFTSGTTGQVQVSFAFQRSQQQNPFKDRSGITSLCMLVNRKSDFVILRWYGLKVLNS